MELVCIFPITLQLVELLENENVVHVQEYIPLCIAKTYRPVNIYPGTYSVLHCKYK